MTNYANNYASAIYRSLIWCLLAGCLFGPKQDSDGSPVLKQSPAGSGCGAFT